MAVISRSDLENRLGSLMSMLDTASAGIEQAKAQVAQAQANFNAIEGAIQDVKHWLHVLDAAEGEQPKLSAVDPA